MLLWVCIYNHIYQMHININHFSRTISNKVFVDRITWHFWLHETNFVIIIVNKDPTRDRLKKNLTTRTMPRRVLSSPRFPSEIFQYHSCCNMCSKVRKGRVGADQKVPSPPDPQVNQNRRHLSDLLFAIPNVIYKTMVSRLTFFDWQLH